MRSRASKLADTIASVRHESAEEVAREAAQELLGLIPTFTLNDMKMVLYHLGKCNDESPAWRREVAGFVAETVIAKTPTSENPLMLGIRQMLREIQALSFSGVDVIPSFIQLIVFGIILLLFLILWPYGFVPVIASSLQKIMLITRFRMKFRTHTPIEKMPYTTAMGIYFLVWLVFALLCLPFSVVGWIGERLAD